jgi:transposase
VRYSLLKNPKASSSGRVDIQLVLACRRIYGNGYSVHLVNPSAIKQYEGLKHSDDERQAFHLAHLLKLGIVPEGYIYPKEERPVRDLLRKRLQLVRHRTSHSLSFKNLVSRNLGIQMSSNEIKGLREEDVEVIRNEEHLLSCI